jgi:glycosyltransferase involved in cell wall biosynthesis/thymidylate kinase
VPRGDWDLAVANAADFSSQMIGRFGEPDLLIRRQYVEQLFYEWNQVDLLSTFEWNGIEYLDIQRFWDGVTKEEDGLPRPRLAHDAFIAWMTGVLWGARYNLNYTPLITKAFNDDALELKECMRHAFGRGWADQLIEWIRSGNPQAAATYAKSLRRALIWNALRRAPGESLWNQVTHWYVEFCHHLKPPYPWVAILGPDGSGKSSVIEGLTNTLAQRRLGIRMIHWSPRIIRKGADAVGPVSDPHSKPPRGLLTSAAKLLVIGAEWWTAWTWLLRHSSAKSKLLVSDRYYDDLLVDPRRYRFGAPLSWARSFFQLLPKPDRVIILAGDPAIIHARKEEVTLDELTRQLAKYRSLADEIGERAVVVDCTSPLSVVVQEVYQETLNACRGRTAYLPAPRPQRYHPGQSPYTPPQPPVVELGPALIQRRFRVLISAYACHPDRGAEANVAWNLVSELSQKHEIWVITRSTNREGIVNSPETWTLGVRWIYIDPPRVLTFWRIGKRGIPPFYAIWQWLARLEAIDLLKHHAFDVSHHITIGTYLVPSPLSDLGPPLLFGPVGGGEQTPNGLSGYFSWKGKRDESLRDWARRTLERMDWLHHWFTASAWTLAATPATLTALRRLGVTRISLFPQSATGGDAVERFIQQNPRSPRPANRPLQLITACRLVHWKAVELAIQAVTSARSYGTDVHLTILEEGPEQPHLRKLTHLLGISSYVSFRGRLPSLDQVYEAIQDSDALIHPSLHEAFGQACLEALALGVPVICLNWGGPGLIVDETCGFRIEPTTREETIAGLANAIQKLHQELTTGKDYGPACVERSKAFQWKDMAAKIEEIYHQVLKQATTPTQQPTTNSR